MSHRLAAFLSLVLVSGCACGTTTSGLSYDPTNVPFGVFDLHRPAGAASNTPLPTVLLIHGGGWYSGDKTDWDFSTNIFNSDFADSLTCHGYCVVVPNYRLTLALPGAGFTAAPWPAQIQNIQTAFAHFRAHPELGVDPNRIAVMGASAGGQLALMLGLQGNGPRPKCVVDVSGESNLNLPAAQVMANYDYITGLLLGHYPPFAPGELQVVSPINFVRPDVNVLLMHSIGDTNVYVNQSDLMDAALGTSGAKHTYIRLPGTDHGSDIFKNQPDATSKMLAFLDANL
jgi:acetyl esterase/lipase